MNMNGTGTASWRVCVSPRGIFSICCYGRLRPEGGPYIYMEYGEGPLGQAASVVPHNFGSFV